MSVWELIIIGATVVVVVGGGLALLAGRNPADLSEADGRRQRQGRHVIDRPAGPDAEAMQAPSSVEQSELDEP